MVEPLADLLVYGAGACLLGAAFHWWRPDLPKRLLLGYGVVALLFLGPALLTDRHQVPTDLAYRWRPWNEVHEGQVGARNPLLADLTLQMLPFRALVREAWLSGHPPLWSHELGPGQPLLGNAQAAPLAPLHLLALPLPPLRAMTVALAWQLFLGLLFVHGLVRALGGSRPGAVLAALAFTFSSFSVVWAYYPLGMTAMWLPGVLLGVVGWWRREERSSTGLVATGLGLALSGHPETLAHTALVATILVAVLLVRRPAERSRLPSLLLCGGITFALAAPALLPVLEALPDSERRWVLDRSPERLEVPDFHPRLLSPLIHPLVFGSPRDGNWSGPHNYNELASGYAGLLPLAVAVAGAAALGGRIAAILGGGLLALLAAYKVQPFIGLLTALPLLEHGAHGRLRLFWVLAVAVAAGLALDPLMRSSAGRRWLAVALLVLLGSALALGVPAPLWQRVWLVTSAGASLLFLIALWWSRPGGPPPRGLHLLALLAVLVDLWALGLRYNPVVGPEMALDPPPALRFLVEETRLALGEEGGHEPFRVLGQGWTLVPNLPAYFGLWSPLGNDPARPFRAARFVSRRLFESGDPGATVLERPLRYDVAALRYLGVRYLLTRHRRQMPAAWRLALRDQGGKVWELTERLPLFFLPREVRVESDPDRALHRALLIEDFAGLAIVESGAPAVAQGGEVERLEVGPNRFSLRLSGTGGLVASSVAFSRGWRVEVDSVSTPTLQVNGAFLGFRVPPGPRSVRLVYRPAGWTVGLVLAGLAILLLALSVLTRRWRRRRPAAAGDRGAPAAGLRSGPSARER